MNEVNIVRAVWFALVASAIVTHAQAQALRGQFLDSSGRPAVAALVTLTDSTGAASVTLTDSTGGYAVQAYQVGFHTLRVERIGFVPLSGGVVLNIGETVLSDTLKSMPVALGEIRPVNSAGCLENASVNVLWAEARKAFRVIVQAEDLDLVRVNGVRYMRELNGQTRGQLAIIDQEAFSATGVPAREPTPGVAAGAWFAVVDSTNPMYFAASARALASDEFERNHCFKAITADAKDTTRVGLVFEPRQGQSSVGISGTAWLDRQTGRPLLVEYSYHAGSGSNALTATGLVEFSSRPQAIPHVSRWWLQLPITRVVTNAEHRGARQLRTIVEDGALVFNSALAPISDPDNLMAALRGAYALDPIIVETEASTTRRLIVPTASGRFSDALSDREIQFPAGTNAWDLVRSTRPRWLEYRKAGDSIRVAVVVDGVAVTREGVFADEVLKQIPAPWIEAMQFLDAIEGPAYYGMTAAYGAILIRLRRQ